MSVTLPLSEPISAHGKILEALELRKPTGVDIRRCGVPYVLREDTYGKTEISFNCENVAKLIETLAQIPESSVNGMSAEDFQAAMGVITGFFGAKTSASTLPGTQT
jgi:hypothetical protein